MKSLVVSLLCLAGAFAHAKEPISSDELRKKIILQAQTFITDKSGKQIERLGDSKATYSLQAKVGEISGTYIENPEGFKPVRLALNLKVNADKTITLVVTQYGSIETDEATGSITKEGKVRTEAFTLTDFGSVSWENEATDKGRVVTRFVPLVSDESDATKLSYTPMSLAKVIITDNAGRVWAEGSSADGEVVTFHTYLGTVYLSFTEFPGSKEIGISKGNLVELNLSDKLNVRIRSEQPVLGPNVSAKVFGAYLPSDKSASRTASSVGAMSGVNAAKKIAGKKN